MPSTPKAHIVSKYERVEVRFCMGWCCGESVDAPACVVSPYRTRCRSVIEPRCACAGGRRGSPPPPMPVKMPVKMPMPSTARHARCGAEWRREIRRPPRPCACPRPVAPAARGTSPQRERARRLGLRARSTCRVRMTLPPGPGKRESTKHSKSERIWFGV